jgi:hypothetical protein
MRKTTKTITEVTHEHGVVSFELPAYEKLLDLVSMDSMRPEHIDMIVEKTIKVTEEHDGEPLTADHLPAIVSGTPAAAIPATAIVPV